MIRVVHVAPRADFQLVLDFTSGERRRFDMRGYLDLPVYRKLRNPGFFALATVDAGTVVWPGEIDIAPETLHARSVPVDPTASGSL